MPSPCPCRGCKAAYEAGLNDQQWAEQAYEQGYDSGWKHGHDEGRVLGYAEGKEAMRKYLFADDENAYAQGYREGYNDHARSRAYAEAVYGPYVQHGKGENP